MFLKQIPTKYYKDDFKTHYRISGPHLLVCKSMLFLLNDVCSPKNANLMIFGLTRPGFNTQSTALEASTLTITPPIRFRWIRQTKDIILRLNWFAYILKELIHTLCNKQTLTSSIYQPIYFLLDLNTKNVHIFYCLHILWDNILFDGRNTALKA